MRAKETKTYLHRSSYLSMRTETPRGKKVFTKKKIEVPRETRVLSEEASTFDLRYSTQAGYTALFVAM
jgi:hypothetical protein